MLNLADSGARHWSGPARNPHSTEVEGYPSRNEPSGDWWSFRDQHMNRRYG